MLINNLASRIMSKRAMKHMCNDLYQVYCNTDYSNYEISVSYDEEKRILFIPKPVMALSIVDKDLHDWLAEQMDNLLIENVMVA